MSLRDFFRDAGLLFLFSPTLALAGYHNLIATSDGSSIYFTFQQTPSVAGSFFASIATDGTISVQAAGSYIVDVNRTGDSILRTSYFPKVILDCSTKGGVCEFAPVCAATFSVQSPSGEFDQIRWPTFARFNGSGRSFWTTQPTFCGPIDINVPKGVPAGLHLTASPSQVLVAAGDSLLQLANTRIGRRAITDTDRVLILTGQRLQWLDSTGSTDLPQLADAFEAVVDSTGDNIVYVDPIGNLRWLNAGADMDLGLTGSAPTLTEDGQTLVYLARDHTLQAYSLSTGSAVQLGTDKYSEFTLAGSSAAFAVSTRGRLDRIDLVSQSVWAWLQPPLEVDASSIRPMLQPAYKELYYVPPEPTLYTGPGEIVTFPGKAVDAAGLQVSLVSATGDVRMLNLPVASPAKGWFQIPQDIAVPQPSFGVPQYSLQIAPQDQPALAYSIQVYLSAGAAYCLALRHEDNAGPVTVDNPAMIGEVVRYYLSGLVGVESVPDDTPNPTDHAIAVANPPPLMTPSSYNVLFFGLEPGVVGVQRLDLQVLQPQTSPYLFVNGYCAPPPVVP